MGVIVEDQRYYTIVLLFKSTICNIKMICFSLLCLALLGGASCNTDQDSNFKYDQANQELESVGFDDMDMDRDMSGDLYDRALATSECKLIQAGYTWVFNVTVDKMVSGVNVATCAEKCLHYSWCKGYTWALDDSSGSICHMFHELNNQHACNNCSKCISGQFTPLKGCLGVCSEEAENIIAANETPTALGCVELCALTEGCKFYSWGSGSLFPNTCFMLNKCTPTTSCEGFKSGQLHCESPPMPAQCTDYLILDDSTRHISYGKGHYCDDNYGDHWWDDDTAPDWQNGTNWYRILPPAGRVIPDVSPDWHHCGTTATGWFKGSHPLGVGETKNGTICFDNGVTDCFMSKEIQVTKCHPDFYVYNLPEIDLCDLRYCGADSLSNP